MSTQRDSAGVRIGEAGCGRAEGAKQTAFGRRTPLLSLNHPKSNDFWTLTAFLSLNRPKSNDFWTPTAFLSLNRPNSNGFWTPSPSFKLESSKIHRLLDTDRLLKSKSSRIRQLLDADSFHHPKTVLQNPSTYELYIEEAPFGACFRFLHLRKSPNGASFL